MPREDEATPANAQANRATFTVSSDSERVVVYPERSRTRTSGGRSPSVQSPASSGGSRSYSGSGGSDSWSEVGPPYEDEDDGIEPSDSASRSRQQSSRRYAPEAPTAPSRRSASRRHRDREESPPRRHRSSRKHHHSSHSSRPRRSDSRRVPSDESNSTVASHDDYPWSHQGQPPPRGYPPAGGYRHVPAPAPPPPQSHGGYPPSMTSAPGYGDPFAAQQALVHMPQQDPFGYPQQNPFSPHGSQGNPFSPGSSAASSYFPPDPHAMPPHLRPQGPTRPQSFVAPSSHYGSDMMSPYGPPTMPAYPGYGMHPGMVAGMPGYPPWYATPSHASPPPPAAPPAKDDKKADEIDALKALIQKHEEARIAREAAMIKKAEADAAARAAEKAREEEEKKKKEEIAAASKAAKEDAEKKAAETAKKAKEEHEKKLKEAETAKAEAEKKHKEVEEEVKKLKPAPDTTKAPIKFKDAVGRKFSFPFHLCKTWKGMEGLIKQAFMHVDVIGEHVHQGHYDLTGPDGEIILPQVWDTMIQPDWEISMHMWPMPEPEKGHDKLAQDAAALADPFANMFMDPKKPKKKGSTSKKDKKGDPNPFMGMGPLPGPPGPGDIPPPPNFPPGILPDPLMGMYPPGIVPVDEKKAKRSTSTRSKSSAPLPPLAAWFAGGSSSSRPKKK